MTLGFHLLVLYKIDKIKIDVGNNLNQDSMCYQIGTHHIRNGEDLFPYKTM